MFVQHWCILLLTLNHAVLFIGGQRAVLIKRRQLLLLKHEAFLMMLNWIHCTHQTQRQCMLLNCLLTLPSNFPYIVAFSQKV